MAVYDGSLEARLKRAEAVEARKISEEARKREEEKASTQSSKKEKEKYLGLHVNILSNLALHRDTKINLIPAWQGDTRCDVTTGEVWVADITPDKDILLGHAFHEFGHAVATEAINWKEHGIEEKETEMHQRQLCSLEDFRVERLMGKIYPPSDFYIKTAHRAFRLEFVQDRKIKELVENPMYVLHLLLGGIDLTKFVQKDCRKVIRQAHADLVKERFSEYPSTRSLIPLAKDIYNRLKPWMKNAEFEDQKDDGGKELIKKSPGSENPIMDGMDDDKGGAPGGESPESKKPKPAPPKRTPAESQMKFNYEIEKLSEEKSGKLKVLKGSTKLSKAEMANYMRPYEPAIKVRRTMDNYEDQEASHPILQEAYCIEEGRQIGKRLMQELRFKDKERHRLDDGEFNVDTMIETIQENRGKRTSMDIFSVETPLMHDHTVAILIDMSGSMIHNRGIHNARAAALMLSTALDEMSVPHAIRGFSAESWKLKMVDIVVKDFGEPLDISKLRGMFNGGDPQNRDSDSIRNMTKILASERGKKILFVISDGYPEHPDGVRDDRAFMKHKTTDCKVAIEAAEREGISVVGIGITNEASDFINEVYPKGFSIGNIEELPEKLTQIYIQESAKFRK